MLDHIFLINKILAHNQRSLDSINLTPSENVLSPLARLPFVLDAHSRYFLDDLRLFGDWGFPSGKDLGDIEQQILIPLLKKMAKAEFVNVRPISGINCMTVALAALSKIGETMYSVPVSAGGHPSTLNVASRLGLTVKYIPFLTPHEIDLPLFEKQLLADKPALIYLDQATFLFPLDPAPIRKIIDDNNLDTIIHYDSSHTNGLIFGGVVMNPLVNGAHCFGGSTHKTLPGPHKGFLATNDQRLYALIQEYADHFISHHHMASTISLALTLLEFEHCNGAGMMGQIMKNTDVFCKGLNGNIFSAVRVNGEYTKCHQLWISCNDLERARPMARNLESAGIILNCFGGLPGLKGPAYRMSLSEFTRWGAREEEAAELAACFNHLGNAPDDIDAVRNRVRTLRKKTSKPEYCYDISEGQVPEIRHVLKTVFI